MDPETMAKVLLIPVLWLVFRKSKSLPLRPLLHWDLDDRVHGHPVTPVRISTDSMFGIALYAPLLLISTIELIVCREYEFVNTSRYCIGFLAAGILTSVIKVTVSRPRPNAIAFEQRIKHMSSSSSSSSQSNNDNNNNSDSDCHNWFSSHSHAHVGRQSFLSGHAFGGVFASTFTSLFLMNACPWIPAPVLCLVFLSGLYPGLTQAMDHWHHETDVLAGYAFGLSTALLSFCY